eukprot:9814187-Heterocapsa_arctica.AAC.1
MAPAGGQQPGYGRCLVELGPQQGERAVHQGAVSGPQGQVQELGLQELQRRLLRQGRVPALQGQARQRVSQELQWQLMELKPLGKQRQQGLGRKGQAGRP